MELRRREPFYREALTLHPILRLSGKEGNRHRRHLETIGHLESALELFSPSNYAFLGGHDYPLSFRPFSPRFRPI